MCQPEAYSEPYQTFMMERVAKIVKDIYPLINFTKLSILDIRDGREYAYVIYDINSVFAY